MKKKILSFVLTLCLIIPALMFFGCGKNPPEEEWQKYVGKYMAAEFTERDSYTITRENYEANPENYNRIEGLSHVFNIMIELKSDFSCVVSVGGQSENGVWVFKNNTINVIGNGVTTNFLIEDDNSLILEHMIEGNNFTKLVKIK